MKVNRMKFIVYAVLMFFLFMLVIESSYSFLGRYITFGLFKIVSLGKYGINFLFELVLAIIALIIVLLSKNHYIFLDDNLSNQVQQSNKYSLNNSLGVL